MKIDQKKLAIFMVLVVDCIVGFIVIKENFSNKDVVLAQPKNNKVVLQSLNQTVEATSKDVEVKAKEEEIKASIVYDNMTLEELSAKLEKSMNSSLKGKGALFASYSIELGLDPYLAVAIVLHETGCSYDCSQLVKTCNNVGGLKGNPGCNGGSYMAFNTLDEGIKGYLDILYNNYYAKGLKTPEQINPKYAASQTWATKINWYINKIKAK